MKGRKEGIVNRSNAPYPDQPGIKAILIHAFSSAGKVTMSLGLLHLLHIDKYVYDYLAYRFRVQLLKCKTSELADYYRRKKNKNS